MVKRKMELNLYGEKRFGWLTESFLEDMLIAVYTDDLDMYKERIIVVTWQYGVRNIKKDKSDKTCKGRQFFLILMERCGMRIS